jgi:hypothetical protein
MEPIKRTIKTVLDVIEEVDRFKMIRTYDLCAAKKIRHQIYVETLQQIARLSTDDYARDMAIEALNAEDAHAS